jgi:nicotinamidase-related amidase
MTETISLDPRTAALLLMDFQTGIVENFADDREALLARSASLLEAARLAGLKIIHVMVAFRAGHPEASARNKSFGAIRESGRFVEGTAGTEIHAALAPKPGDIVVSKRRVSAFSGSDLEIVLRAGGIETLVLAGIATSGVVLSTVRHAADADYRIVVVSDACADRDPEVHRVLLEKVFPRQATVATVAEVRRAFGPSTG